MFSKGTSQLPPPRFVFCWRFHKSDGVGQEMTAVLVVVMRTAKAGAAGVSGGET